MLQNELISRYAGELFELLAPVKVTGSLKINLISWLNGLAGATDSSYMYYIIQSVSQSAPSSSRVGNDAKSRSLRGTVGTGESESIWPL